MKQTGKPIENDAFQAESASLNLQQVQLKSFPLKVQFLCTSLVLLIFVWPVLLNGSLGDISGSALYSFLGIIGASFANLSGAGGGIVFIPVFAQLGLSESQSIATSFGIQYFGMTAGAITWSHHYFKNFRNSINWQSFPMIVALVSATSITGLWSVYSGGTEPPSSLSNSFSIFSIVLGIALLMQTLLISQPIKTTSKLLIADYLALIAVGYFGGIITAWLSVGVGELLVLYLLMRRFDVTLSIAAAVVVTAITVWSASFEHLWSNQFTVWQIVLFAGPGAIIGGAMAKTLASMFSTRNLKIILGCWVLAMGLIG